MGTDKRQRQKEGRAIRIAAAEAAQKKAEQRALVLRVILVVVVVAAAVGGLFLWANRSDDDTASSTTVDPLATTTTFPVDTSAPLPSAAGLPCVAQVTPAASGEPTVPVKEGEPPTELVIEDLTVGSGEEVTDPNQTVRVNYVGVACSTGVKFDSSFERGEPVEFPLSGVIPGWTQGLIGMKVGGTRLLGIPSELAYGAEGGGPDIAPDEPLWFVVTLEGIVAATDPSSTDPSASDPSSTDPSATATTVPASTDTTAAGGSATTVAP